MKKIEEVVACVIDRGTFFPVAERLARGFGKVYYHKPDGESFRTVANGALGDGNPKVQWLDDYWPIKDQIDVFVFPDCRDGGLQWELANQGFPVWGSRNASLLESFRGRWHKLCQELGMPLPETNEVVGLENLAAFLRENEGESWFVKISEWRGDMETWEAKNRQQVEHKLAWLQMRWGPMSRHMKFFVQKKLDTDIESGSDTYNVWGEYPDEVIIGYEKKGESYFAAVRPASEMAPEVWSLSKGIQPTLAEMRYANFVSSEIRIKDGEGYWLDPCFRCPSPAGEEQLEMYENFPEIVYAGAQGELVQPKWAAKFCGEAVIAYTGDREAWKAVTVPDEVKQWVKLYANIEDDGAYHFPPAQDPEAIGCAVALGDDPEEIVDKLKEIAEAMKDSPVSLNIQPLADLFAEIKEAEKEGIEFAQEPVPEPATVL
jgi:hypothetical protein